MAAATNIDPKRKTEFCGTSDKLYIVRSDLSEYLESSDFTKGTDTVIRYLHPDCRDGDHYLSYLHTPWLDAFTSISYESHFIIISGDHFRRVTDLSTAANMSADTRLHEKCRGGDFYLATSSTSFVIIFSEQGMYRVVSDLGTAKDAKEYKLHDTWKGGLYCFATKTYWLAMATVRYYLVRLEAGEYRFLYNKDLQADCASGATQSFHPAVKSFLTISQIVPKTSEPEPKTEAEGPSSSPSLVIPETGSALAPATINLYGQTYEQIVKKALAGSSKNFQLLNPKENWTWALASAGFIDPQAYRFVGQVPTWSAVGAYEPSGKDMHQAYLQVLSLWNVIGEGRNEDRVREAREQVTRAQTTFVQDHQKANEGYVQYKKTLPTGTPVESYDAWMAKFWKGILDADKLAFDRDLETMGLVIDQKNAGLKDAIDAATVPKDHTDPKPGFLKVQIGTTIGVRPAYIFEDPKGWADRVTNQGGGDSLTIELSATASSSSLSQSWAGGSTGLDDGFFSTCGSGGWQMMDLVEDKTMKVAITIKAFGMFEVGPDTAWYDSGLLKRLATEDNWNPPYSTKGGADKKPVFGKDGVLPLVVTSLIAGFQPSIDITMSDVTYSKYKQLWDASSGVRVGPFQIGGSASQTDQSWSKNTDNKTFHVESKATYPFIMGITVANPGE